VEYHEVTGSSSSSSGGGGGGDRTYLQHITQGLHQLHAIVFGWVVRRRDHDTNPFALE